MTGSPLKVISPDVLEIKGAYPSSPTIYVRVDNIQGFLVNHRLSTIELYTTGVPVKIIDCSSSQINVCVEILSQFLTKKSKTLEDISNRVTELESHIYTEIPLELSVEGSAEDSAHESAPEDVPEEDHAPVEKPDPMDDTCLDVCGSTCVTLLFIVIVCNGMYYMNSMNTIPLESF